MMCHGADLHDFESQLAGVWGDANDRDAFVWKVRLLRSLGYSDWKTNESVETILYGACWHSHMELALFALEVVRIDPNLTSGFKRAPLGNAAQRQWVEGVAVLLEAGASPNISNGSWNGTPLFRSFSGLLSDTSHFLLLQSSNPNTSDSQGITIWNRLCQYLGPWWDVTWRDNVSFIHFEGSLAHLLHHGSDPFEIFITTNRNGLRNDQLPRLWFETASHVRACDAARFWSYGIEKIHPSEDAIPDSVRLNPDLEEWKQEVHLAERTGNLKWTFRWDRYGNIKRSSVDRNVKDTNLNDRDDADQSTDDPAKEDDGLKRGIVAKNDRRNKSDGITGSDNSSNEENIKQVDDSSKKYPRLTPGFFRNATAFYRHISNEQGRRQLSRFPMVRACCDALQHAGYRAEMDDDGDIWYDCDDGDRYFDAWEAPIEGDDPEVWLPKVCPICQDFPGYGLGHVLERAGRGKQQYYEYKEQVRQGERALYI